MIEIVATSSARIVDAPLHVAYDSEVLRFLDASAGGFLSLDGGQLVFLANGHTRPGDVAIGIGRTNRTLGLEGTGTLCRLRFVALAAGATTIGISRAMAWTDTGRLLPVRLASLELHLR